jgi:uncharacterized membrane-anchored protein
MEKLNKVAGITISFWIMKIIATTLGETLGDLLSMTLNIGYTISLLITMFFFLIVLVAQLKVSKYYPALYWLVIVGTTTVGTEISDYMDRTLDLGYATGSAVLFSALLITLFLWYTTLKRINITQILSQKEELFYWTAILFSNSLGTAFGDFLGDVVGLSYLEGAFVTAGIIAIVVLLHYATKLNHVLLFWIAFIFTRPFGATFGDLLTKPIAKGGLDLGTLPATLVSIGLLAILIIYATSKQQKKEKIE